MRKASWPGAVVDIDEWRGYDRLPEMGRGHATVCHAEREWARDDDGDGVREVHDNTLKGLWPGLRHFLRQFRGVSKKHLYQYMAMFEWGYNAKRATTDTSPAWPASPDRRRPRAGSPPGDDRPMTGAGAEGPGPGHLDFPRCKPPPRGLRPAGSSRKIDLP